MFSRFFSSTAAPTNWKNKPSPLIAFLVHLKRSLTLLLSEGVGQAQHLILCKTRLIFHLSFTYLSLVKKRTPNLFLIPSCTFIDLPILNADLPVFYLFHLCFWYRICFIAIRSIYSGHQLNTEASRLGLQFGASHSFPLDLRAE